MQYPARSHWQSSRLLREEIDDLKVLNLSADASIDAGVSLTGV